MRMTPSPHFIAVFSFAFSAALLGIAPALAFQNEPKGFRDLEWGTKFSSVSRQMYSMGEYQGDKLYMRLGDNWSLLGMPLTRIVYVFHQDRLSSVMLTTGANASEQIEMKFREQFGEPEYAKSDESGAPQDEWSGPTSSVGLLCNKIGICDIMIESTKNLQREPPRPNPSAPGPRYDGF